jgi:transcriptional antiterminator NusG
MTIADLPPDAASNEVDLTAGETTGEAAPVETPADPQLSAPESAQEPAGESETIESETVAPIGSGEPLVQEGMQWYVLRVASNREDQVRDALERKIKIEDLAERVGRVLVPTQKEKRMRGGRARVYYRKLYPGYVFVEMATEPDGSITESVWFLVKDTSGVGDFISSGGKPSPMSMDEVEKMLSAVIKPDDQPTLANVRFKKGDKVKIQEGPFENFEGVVDEINSQKGTVRVIVTIFGRATPIEMEYWQVETV